MKCDFAKRKNKKKNKKLPKLKKNKILFLYSSCPEPPASCTDGWAQNQPGPNPHVLYGALVGGPDQVSILFLTDSCLHLIYLVGVK